MKAAFLDPEGTPFLADVDAPHAGPGEVVVQVRTAALHHGNLLGAGERPLGSEAVGTVVELGEGTEGVGLAIGQRVGVFPAWGVVRERIALPADQVHPVSDDIPDERVAQLFVNPLTSLLVGRAVRRAVDDAGSPGEGGLVVVSGAASALGQAIVLHLGHQGHRVVAVTRRTSSAERVHTRFEVPAVATETEGWVDALSDVFADVLAGERPRVVVDGHGGPDAHALLGLLAVGGTLLSYGDLSGSPFTLTTSELLGTNPGLRGVSIMRWLPDETAEQRRADVIVAQEFAVAFPDLLPVAETFGLDRLDGAVARVREARGDGVVLVEVGR
jgi:NADPH:quinone reductase-like Zn-dependent oxidoreductase